MYENKDGVVCIPAKLLYEDLGLISLATYNNKSFRRKLKFLQKGGNGRVALVSYEHLPPDLKKGVVKALGTPPENDNDEFLAQYYEVTGEIRYFFETYKLPDGRNLSAEDQKEYIANVAILQAMDRALEDSHYCKKGRNNNSPPNWQNLRNEVLRMKYRVIDGESPYWHNLPESLARLRQSYNKYKKDGMESVIRLGKFNNSNASKIVTDEQKAVMIELTANGRNLNYTEVAKFYNVVASAFKWEEISAKAAETWHKKNFRVTNAGRYGKQHYKNNLAMQVKRYGPTSPLLFWSADGWDAELYYQNEKSYTNSLTIEIIIDAYNGYPVGYAIGGKETGALIKSAMRNALNHMKELLGARYRTWQVQSDRYAIKAMTPLWETLAHTFTPAEAHNAKSKPIEQWFNHEMQPRCKMYNNWSGYGVKSSVKNQVSVDFINANKKGYPDLQGCIRQLEKIIEDIRAEKKEAFVEAFNQMDEEKKLVLTDEMFYYKFGEKTLPNKLFGTGVCPTIEDANMLSIALISILGIIKKNVGKYIMTQATKARYWQWQKVTISCAS